MDEFVADVANGDHVSKGWANTAYGTGCLAVIALTKIHARQMACSGKDDVLVNTCCPGWVRTDMAGPNAPLSPDEGAVTPYMLHCCQKEVLQESSGRNRL